jgi:hypothetical protein
LVPALVCALTLGGCALRGDVEALESELRKQELAREGMADELQRAREELRIARTDSAALRTQLAERRQTALSPDQADVFYRVESIKFNMLLTSGQERDGQPGDDALSVLLMPVDTHGDLVKLAGDVDLELFDMSQTPERQRLGQWSFNIDDVRQHWHKGLFSAGYLFQMDWQTLPVSPELTLHARMSVPDGRQFDATTQIKIAPPGQGPAAVTRAAHLRPGRPAAQRVSTGSSGRGIPEAAGKASLRQPELAPESRGSPPEIRPGARAGHADPPTQTSDNWTEETIPRLR